MSMNNFVYWIKVDDFLLSVLYKILTKQKSKIKQIIFFYEIYIKYALKSTLFLKLLETTL